MKNETSTRKSGLFPPIDRRRFLKALGGGIVITFTLDFPAGAQYGAAPPRADQKLPTDWNAFIRIGEDGRIACYTGKIEMGQGIVTSLAQMAADELDVPPGSIDMVMGDTDLCPWDMGTFGSRSTKYFGPALRDAAAEAKTVLIQLASDHLKVPATQLRVAEGAIFPSGKPNQRVTYAELAKGKRIEKHIGQKPPVKPASARTVSGKPFQRADALDKVTGKAKYAGDIRLPEMLYASILRPPAHGATLKSVELSGAEKFPGARVVREGDFIAVLHTAPDLAEKALSLVKAEYATPESSLDQDSIIRHLSAKVPEGTVVASAGSIDQGKSQAVKIIEHTYEVPYVAHTPMEPHTAVAHVEGNKATVWASTQRPFGAKEEVAQELGIPPENVRVITPWVGGGFGSKSRNTQAVEAAKLSKTAGKPVQVAWSREEEFFNDTFQPAAFVVVSSGLNTLNEIVFWDFKVCFAGDRCSQPVYEFPNYRVTSHGSSFGGSGVHPFGVGAWRGPGANTNTFARESHMDVMAAAAGADPLAFRLAHLKDKRMRQVLQAAADRFGWFPGELPARRGKGLACVDYLGTCVAEMAEVEVNRESGGIAVKRLVFAVDMGEIINPEGAKIQVEGCATMGLGYALTERVRFKGGAILDRNFDSYEIPRFSWLPQIDVVLVDNPDLAPQGCGEPAITCTGAAIANAVFDAVGVRLFQLPMTPERVKSTPSKI